MALANSHHAGTLARMQRHGRGLFCLAAAVVVGLGGSPRAAAERASRVLATSENGELRVERRGEEYWIVSTKDPAQEAQLPVESAESAPVEFHFSPDAEWLFTLPDGGSSRRAGNLFHRDAVGGKIEAVESFDAKAWAQCAKLGALKKNFSAAGAAAMMRFVGWSVDSTRLLVGLRGGESKFEMDAVYLYFRTGTKRFELTPYLRKLNVSTSDILSSFDDPLPCAEPAGPLPPAADLKTRLEKLDAELNESYAKLIKATPEERVESVRAAQRNWLKRRDKGLRVYLSVAKSAEKESRRLQFLGDVTGARLAATPEEWDTAETWLY